MILELCKGVHSVDLGESFQTHIYLQNLASIQPRTSPVKFASLAVSLSTQLEMGADLRAVLRAVRLREKHRLHYEDAGVLPVGQT